MTRSNVDAPRAGKASSTRRRAEITKQKVVSSIMRSIVRENGRETVMETECREAVSTTTAVDIRHTLSTLEAADGRALVHHSYIAREAIVNIEQSRRSFRAAYPDWQVVGPAYVDLVLLGVRAYLACTALHLTWSQLLALPVQWDSVDMAAIFRTKLIWQAAYGGHVDDTAVIELQDVDIGRSEAAIRLRVSEQGVDTRLVIPCDPFLLKMLPRRCDQTRAMLLTRCAGEICLKS